MELALHRRYRDELGRTVGWSSTVSKTVPFLKSVLKCSHHGVDGNCVHRNWSDRIGAVRVAKAGRNGVCIPRLLLLYYFQNAYSKMKTNIGL